MENRIGEPSEEETDIVFELGGDSGPGRTDRLTSVLLIRTGVGVRIPSVRVTSTAAEKLGPEAAVTSNRPVYLPAVRPVALTLTVNCAGAVLDEGLAASQAAPGWTATLNGAALPLLITTTFCGAMFDAPGLPLNVSEAGETRNGPGGGATVKVTSTTTGGAPAELTVIVPI